MATVKKVNYTTEQTESILQDYKAGLTVEEIAAKTGRAVKSLVAKLSREGVYKPQKAYKTKTGEEPVKKDELADKIGKLVPELTENDIESLGKANKIALKAILETLEKMGEGATEDTAEDTTNKE